MTTSDNVRVSYRRRQTTTLYLDFDSPLIPESFLENYAFLKRTLDVETGPTLDIYASHNGGRHVVITLHGKYPSLAVVAMQAILGSDPRRETFNLFRALSLGNAPAFWRENARWNVLYSEKLEAKPMIDPKDYGREPVKISDIGDAEVAVLTVTNVEQTESNMDGESRPRLFLESREFPEKVYYVNVTGIRVLVGKLGNDEARWVGCRVPLVRAMAPNPRNKNKLQPALHIAPAEKWDELLAEYDGVLGNRETAKTAGRRATPRKRR